MFNIFIKYYSNSKLITIPKPSLTIELHTCKAYADLEVYVARMVRGGVGVGGAKVLEGYQRNLPPLPLPLEKKNHGPVLARDISN